MQLQLKRQTQSSIKGDKMSKLWYHGNNYIIIPLNNGERCSND